MTVWNTILAESGEETYAIGPGWPTGAGALAGLREDVAEVFAGISAPQVDLLREAVDGLADDREGVVVSGTSIWGIYASERPEELDRDANRVLDVVLYEAPPRGLGMPRPATPRRRSEQAAVEARDWHGVLVRLFHEINRN